MIIVGIIQACVITLLAFCWHRQRAQLAWVDERDKLLGPIMEHIQSAIMLNVPQHGENEIDGVRVGGKLIPSKVGMQQIWVMWEQLQEAWGFQRNQISAMGRDYGRLKNWEVAHPVPGPEWVCWPYVIQREPEQKVIEALEKRD